MKKILSILLITLLVLGCFPLSASAQEPQDILLSRTIEILENGDSIVTELFENAVQPRTGKAVIKLQHIATLLGPLFGM